MTTEGAGQEDSMHKTNPVERALGGALKREFGPVVAPRIARVIEICGPRFSGKIYEALAHLETDEVIDKVLDRIEAAMRLSRLDEECDEAERKLRERMFEDFDEVREILAPSVQPLPDEDKEILKKEQTPDAL